MTIKEAVNAWHYKIHGVGMTDTAWRECLCDSEIIEIFNERCGCCDGNCDSCEIAKIVNKIGGFAEQ